MRRLTLLLGLWAGLPGSPVAPAGPLAAQAVDSGWVADARRVIDAGNDAYKAAFLRADVAALAQVYDVHGARLNEGGDVLRGREAIARDVGAFLAAVGPVRVTIETATVWLVDDTAYETGAWSYTFTPKGKAGQHIGGKYVTLWKRQDDGGWRIWADIGVPGT